MRVTTRVLEGSAPEQIRRAVRSKHARLVIMGTHGRSALGQLLLGSVAARVIDTAPCPVLTVRGR